MGQSESLLGIMPQGAEVRDDPVQAATSGAAVSKCTWTTSYCQLFLLEKSKPSGR